MIFKDVFRNGGASAEIGNFMSKVSLHFSSASGLNDQLPAAIRAKVPQRA